MDGTGSWRNGDTAGIGRFYLDRSQACKSISRKVTYEGEMVQANWTG